MVCFIRCFVLVALLLVPAVARAAHPLQVEDTATEGKGNFLFELTEDYLKDNEFKTTKRTGIITAGIAEHADLSLAVPYLLLRPGQVSGQDASGMGDMRLQLKSQIFENEVKQSMAYLIFLDMPTGEAAKGLGTNNVVWGVKLVDSQECRRCIFHLNVGYEAFGKDTRRQHFLEDHAFTFGFAAGHRITNSFRILTEFAGEIRKEKGLNEKPFTFLAGMVYDISKSWYVDLGVRAGLNRDAEDYALLAGAHWRF